MDDCRKPGVYSAEGQYLGKLWPLPNKTGTTLVGAIFNPGDREIRWMTDGAHAALAPPPPDDGVR